MINADVVENPVEPNKVDLNIILNEGIQFKFGQISFEGNDKTQDKVMRRELYTLPGDYFSKSAIKRSMQQLSGLNYFNPENFHRIYLLPMTVR
ncbi:MAG: POTRA domain-containing protein [Ignavibacteria bacterium]